MIITDDNKSDDWSSVHVVAIKHTRACDAKFAFALHLDAARVLIIFV